MTSIRITFKNGVTTTITNVVKYEVTGGDIIVIKGARSCIGSLTFKEPDTYVKNPTMVEIKGDNKRILCEFADITLEEIVG